MGMQFNRHKLKSRLIEFVKITKISRKTIQKCKKEDEI